jgi:hypothetical protein
MRLVTAMSTSFAEVTEAYTRYHHMPFGADALQQILEERCKHFNDHPELYEDEPFIKFSIDEHLFQCCLCDVSGITDSALQPHRGSTRHCQNVLLFVDSLEQVNAASMRACHLYAATRRHEIGMLDELCHARWRDAAHAELYRYLAAPYTSVDELELLERPVTRLKTCLQNERLVLLALAVWKAQCLRQMPVGDFDAAQNWMRCGWKACKPLQRASNAMDIIILAVRSFLE